MQTPVPLLDAKGQPYSDHPAYSLARHFMVCKTTNDADIFNPGYITATVAAYQSVRLSEPAQVQASFRCAGFSVDNKLLPETARALARALLAAADLCDEFEAAQTLSEERALADNATALEVA